MKSHRISASFHACMAVLFVCFMILFTGCSSNTKVTWKTTPAENHPAGEIMELTFEVDREINNPYNSKEIKIDCNVWQQNGDTLIVPAFFHVTYSIENQFKNLVATGDSSWIVRFTPKEAGQYFYMLQISHEGEMVETEPQSFQVSANDFNGFVQARRGERFFRFSSGKIYFPSGINLAHPPHNSEPLDYDYFFRKMKENNMNFTRIWLTPQWGKYALALEWTGNQYPSQAEKLGLRKINSEIAYRLDTIMQSALKHGIYVMLCLLDERELEEGSHWKENPYNVEAGGVISDPMEFFSDEKAKEAFKNRLRYLIAHYSAYPNLFAWEFWNEFDHHRLIPDWEAERENIGKWHQEMSRYLKLHDPHNHMVSTSVVGSRTDKIIWDYEEIDFVQAHSYVGKDHLADRSHDLYRLFKEEYPDRPFFIGEMGTDWHGFTEQNHAEAIGLHNGLWATTLGGHSATGMWWWWYEVDDAALWKDWKSLSVFTEGIDWMKSQPYVINQDNNSKVAGRYVVSGTSVWIWFYNREYNWKNIRDGNPVYKAKPGKINLQNIPAGNYRIMHFEYGGFTKAGKIVSDGSAELILPAFNNGYAIKLVQSN